jgi:ribonucleotide reductase beta subunit family protein with ferritin-like domain
MILLGRAEHLTFNLAADATIKDAWFFFTMQLAIENIHEESCNQYLHDVVPDTACFRLSIINKMIYPYKEVWIEEHGGEDNEFWKRLLLSIAIEDIFFTHVRTYIQKFNRILPGLAYMVERIYKDKTLYCEFACYLYKTYSLLPYTERETRMILDSAIQYEKKIWDTILPQEVFQYNDIISNYMIKLGYIF